MLGKLEDPAIGATDLLFMSAVTQASLVREGRLTAESLVARVIERAKETASRLNAVVIPRYERAMDDARKIDAAVARGEDPGPLCGVPLTIKDGIATAGDRQTLGSRSMADVIAQGDDLVWRRLKSAGAILIGKTATPEFYHEVTTRSELHGVTRNPWSLDRTPGGSSGGAAAALAAGIGSLAVGSDGGGSLRCPAACTGVMALKPTAGRIPHENFPDTFGNYSTIGPMARSLEDLETMFSVMAGPADRDALSLLASHGNDTRVPAADFTRTRVGWMAQPGGYPVEKEIAEICLAAIAGLQSDGVSGLSELDPKLLDGTHEVYRVIGAVGHAGRLRQLGPKARASWGETFREIVDLGMSYSAADLAFAQEERTALFRRVQYAFRTVDVIAMPALTRSPGPADQSCPVHGDDYAAWAAALYPFNLTGHPAITVPCGFTSAGLPVGIQFVARWHEERHLFDISARLPQWKGRPQL